MSRFSDGWDEDYPNQGIMWWSNVERSFKGRRGTEALKRLVDALEVMEPRELANGAWRDVETGQLCALGAMSVAAGRDPATMTEYECEPLEVARLTAQDTGLPWGALYYIEHENDEGKWFGAETPAERWTRIHDWAVKELAAREAKS